MFWSVVKDRWIVWLCDKIETGSDVREWHHWVTVLTHRNRLQPSHRVNARFYTSTIDLQVFTVMCEHV